LEEQYENMKNNKNGRPSLKSSLRIKGVPHTCITLNPRSTAVKNQQDTRSTNSLNLTCHSRNSSILNNETMRVVSIGFECQRKQRPTKSKFSYIQKRVFIYLYFKIELGIWSLTDLYFLLCRLAMDFAIPTFLID
jgi:hypothetical protein